jgi:anti-sigma factor RsiW
MTPAWEPEGPTPEQLAAYFDGELTGSERAGVEAWLAGHPEARAEVEALRQLHAQYDAVPVPEPSPERWAAALAGIRADLARNRPRRNWGWGLAAAGLAAAVLGILFLPIGSPEDTEPYPVVSPDDVLIISMNPNDDKAVVGVRALELPEIDLASHNDVELLGGNTEGVVRIDDWATPMLVDSHALGQR